MSDESTTPRLTHSQRQILLGQRLHPDRPVDTMAFAFHFDGRLDPERFQQAWRKATGDSDALRTRVDLEDGEARVRLGSPPECDRLDLSTEDEPATTFRNWCRDRCTRPLALDRSLVDCVLVDLGATGTGWYLGQHHLVTDALSTQILVRRLADAYAGQTLDPTPSFYRTTTEIERRELASGDRAAAREHWQRPTQGAGSRQPLELYGRPTTGPAGTLGTTASRRRTLRLDRERTAQIAALCSRPGLVSLSPDLSRFAFFASLLATWLYRLGGEPATAGPLRFDSPVAGRPTATARRCPGLFIEMFPFSIQIHADDTALGLAERCLAESLDFLRAARPGLSPSSAAGSVVLNTIPGRFAAVGGLPFEVEWVHSGHSDAVHALRLQVHDLAGEDALTIHLDANRDALDEVRHRRALAHLDRLLDAVLENPDRPITEIDLRTDEECRRAVALATPRPGPRPLRTILEQLRARVRERPERLALCEDDCELRLSYRELWDRTMRLAAQLVELGVRPGDRVAVGGRRSIESVLAVLAILRAGAAFVPLSSSDPPARRRLVVEDSDARLVLVSDGGNEPEDRESAPGTTPVYAVSTLLERSSEPADRRPLDPSLPELPSPTDLAYLIYTSGSTGRPKGVPIEHRGIASYLAWAAATYPISARSARTAEDGETGRRLRYPLCTSLAFDLTMTCLFLPLVTGEVLEIHPESTGAGDLVDTVDTAVLDVVRANRADVLKLTPSHLGWLRRVGLEGSRLRCLIVGGEDFRADLAAAISGQLDDRAAIWNEYGPTEAVVGCVAHRYRPDRDDPSVNRRQSAKSTRHHSVPIGRPANDVGIEIRSPSGTPVPEGVPGELWVRRVGLARGYHGLPEQTAERFLPDPVPADPDAAGAGVDPRIYRTGDRVRIDREGLLTYRGRIDRELKVSGVRIDPDEIESTIRSHPAVEDCAVLARPRHPAAGRSATTTNPNRLPGAAPRTEQHCLRCGLPSSYPKASFDDEGICSICRSYDAIAEHARDYFRTPQELEELFERSRRHREKQHGQALTHDCMMLYSGGKDSTYALCRLVDLGLSVYAFTLDNGFISEGAKDNIRRVTEELGVPVEMATTPAMAAIFRDSLDRFSNVCNGCFKTIYTLALRRARELDIPIIVTGLSRGQMFETRLTEDVFRDGRRRPEEIDAAVLAARKAYHRAEDQVARSLDTRDLRDDAIFEQIRFVDFYRYFDVDMKELYGYLRRRVPWIRPEDTGRSTNCLINDAGIFVHQRERGFHNYALPYSWDVRLGHKTREEAMDELDDEIDPESVRGILREIGDDRLEHAGTATRNETLGSGGDLAIEAFVVASEAAEADGRELGERLRTWLDDRLPTALIPRDLHPIDAIPLTANGKVDENRLLAALPSRSNETDPRRRPYRAPEGPVQELVAELWQEQLGADRVGADDSFFELGGTSLHAVEVILRLGEELDLELPLGAIFEHPTLTGLSRLAEDRILAEEAEG